MAGWTRYEISQTDISIGLESDPDVSTYNITEVKGPIFDEANSKPRNIPVIKIEVHNIP